MANIFYLKPRAGDAVSRLRPEPSGARILFFTGVRYERMQEEGPEPARPRGGPPSRKTPRRRRA